MPIWNKQNFSFLTLDLKLKGDVASIRMCILCTDPAAKTGLFWHFIGQAVVSAWPIESLETSYGSLDPYKKYTFS